MAEPGLSVDKLRRCYEVGGRTLEVLAGVDLELAAGERVAVTGPSGSGKSTFLHIVGTLERPTSGSVKIDGRDPFTSSDDDLARFRNRHLGFVFQEHYLLPQYSVLENVLLPALAEGAAAPGTRERAIALLERVGLDHRMEHRPAELSGGERQRAAIARALIGRPRLLLCDEPTGNLDPAVASEVAELLFELHQAEGGVLIAVTHSEALAERFERRLRLEAGRVAEA